MTLELIATFFALVYISLAINEKQSSWLFAILSSLLYIFLFWQANLYFQSVLQIFFILVSYYGWYSWDSKRQDKLVITSLNLKQNILVVFASLLISLLAWAFLRNIVNISIPILDSLTTFFSISATFLTAQKKIESWYYWFAIDMLSIWMFIDQKLFMTAVVYAGFSVLAVVGLYAWKKKVPCWNKSR